MTYLITLESFLEICKRIDCIIEKCIASQFEPGEFISLHKDWTAFQKEYECIVCSTKASNSIALFACKHYVCGKCAHKITGCPMCRDESEPRPCETWTSAYNQLSYVINIMETWSSGRTLMSMSMGSLSQPNFSALHTMMGSVCKMLREAIEKCERCATPIAPQTHTPTETQPATVASKSAPSQSLVQAPMDPLSKQQTKPPAPSMLTICIERQTELAKQMLQAQYESAEPDQIIETRYGNIYIVCVPFICK